MTDPWLVRTIDNRIRVKWRDEATVVQDEDFDTEAEARAFALRAFGTRDLSFLSDMETSLHHAGRLMKANTGMSPAVALEAVVIKEREWKPMGEGPCRAP